MTCLHIRFDIARTAVFPPAIHQQIAVECFS